MPDQPQTAPLGKTMVNLSWVALLALLTLYFANRESHTHNPNQQLISSEETAFKEVTLQRNPQYHYLANGSINGKEVTFLVDTGASDVAVPAHLAASLGLTPGAQDTVTTANGKVNTRRTRIDTLQLGSIQLLDVAASINPGMDDDEILLGMSFLKHLEFTQKDGQLTLRQTRP